MPSASFYWGWKGPPLFLKDSFSNAILFFFFCLFLNHFTTRREAETLLESKRLLRMEGDSFSPRFRYRTGWVLCVSWVPALLCPCCFISV